MNLRRDVLHTKEYIMYNSIYIMFKNRIVVTFGKEVIEGVRGSGVWLRFCFLTFVPVIQESLLSDYSLNVYTGFVHLSVCYTLIKRILKNDRN